ncbi:MAG: DEAD/DEAH box helicase [Methyloprofundus sp.]|nr:DEAD/DEAH box helicase [Methyloprofundus sp.]
MIKSMVYDQYRVWVQNDYGTADVFKAYAKKHKAYFHPVAKRWVFMRKNARIALSEIAHRLNVSPEKLDALIHASKASDEFVKLLTFKIYPVADDDEKLIIFCEFDWASAYFFRGLAGRFDAKNKAWIVEYDVESLVDELNELNGIPLSSIVYFNSPLKIDTDSQSNLFERSAEVLGQKGDDIIRARDKEFETLSATILHSIRGIESRGFNRQKLNEYCQQIDALPHQSVGIEFLLSRTSCLLADDMGLGKTLQSVVAGHFTDGIKIVLCPKSLTRNWGNEIAKWTGSTKSYYVCPSRSSSIPLGKEWYIFNYEISDKAIAFLEANKIKEIAMAFFDEAHELKNPRSIKSRNAFHIAFKAANRILVTGTPVLNKLNELHTLLMLSGHRLGKLPRKAFLEEYGNSMADARQLKDELATWMLRREKSILGNKLPGKTEQVVEIDLVGSDREQYLAILNNDNLSSIVKFGKLRHLLEDIKVSFIAEQITSIAGEHKSLIFCEYKETVERFKDLFESRGIECVTYTGSDSVSKRDKAVNAIQNGTARVFIGNTKAAGVGITLTSASHVFFASLPWTQALKEQAEDRANRIGQKQLVRIITPIILGTIDNHLKTIIDNKKALGECVVKDELSPDVKMKIMAAASKASRAA